MLSPIAKKPDVSIRVNRYLKQAPSIINDVDLAVKELLQEENSERNMENIGRLMTKRHNDALRADEKGTAKTTTNYMPLGNQVLVETILDVTIRDIIANKDYAGILRSCGGNVFQTGKLNPRCKVIGFGYFVQGINIGDYVDINNVPGAMSIRGVIEGCMDYEGLHEYFSKRNPMTAGAYGIAESKSKIIGRTDFENDLDDTDLPFSIIFKGVIDYNDLRGVYSDPQILNNYLNQ